MRENTRGRRGPFILRTAFADELFVEYNNIGVIDIETYKTDDGINKVYALGFMTSEMSKPVIYYIYKEIIDSSKLILDFVNELMRPKYYNA